MNYEFYHRYFKGPITKDDTRNILNHFDYFNRSHHKVISQKRGHK